MNLISCAWQGVSKDREVIVGRSIDRALRPLFPRGYHYDTQASPVSTLWFDGSLLALRSALPICRNPTPLTHSYLHTHTPTPQVVTSVLSAASDIDPDVLCINAASAALLTSDIPWPGPVAAVRVALSPSGAFLILHPTVADLSTAALNLLLVRSETGVVALEAVGDQVREEDLIRALEAAYAAAEPILAAQKSLAEKCGRIKRRAKLAGADPAAALRIRDLAGPRVERAMRDPGLSRLERARVVTEVRTAVVERLRQLGAFRVNDLRVPGSG